MTHIFKTMSTSGKDNDMDNMTNLQKCKGQTETFIKFIFLHDVERNLE